MTVEILAICDAATTNPEGKLNILGAFDTIRSARFPVAHPQCAIALRMRFSRAETGKHEVRISITDDDGKAIMPELQGVMNVRMRDEEVSAVTNFVINLQQVRFGKPGNYAINLAMDHVHLTSLPLAAKQTSGAPPAE